jgi:hypothetical protein
MKENIPGYPGYHITKDGKVYTHKKGSWKLRKTSNSSSTGRIRVRINYRVPESKLSIIFGISKRHINKIVSQYKSGIRWDNNLI